MLAKKYTNIVYLIGLTIAVTIAVQCYWNYKMYEVHKQQLMNQVQVSFDKALDDYYNNLAKGNVLTIIENDSTFLKDRQIIIKNISKSDSGVWSLNKNLNLLNNQKDSSINQSKNTNNGNWKVGVGIDPKYKTKFDSSYRHLSIRNKDIDTLDIQHLTTKVMFSFQEKMIDLKKVDSLLQEDLIKKEIDIPYGLEFTHLDFISGDTEKMAIRTKQLNKQVRTAIAKSSFLPHDSELKLLYKTPAKTILSTMIGSILLSLLLAVIIISCLIFLIKIIFRQKQLSEVKNDLISNITHEFKTPIATIAVALEGLQNFDAIKNPELTKNYLNMSNEQLDKLNLMVEKLLETASLEGNHFELHKEVLDVVVLLQKLVEKHEANGTKKIFSFKSELITLELKADKFHLENALNNILDNAVKYGGDSILIEINEQGELFIEDNGNGIPQNQQKKIFEQFYRIPTGNIHNVKGFGIGLYYTKHIVEKHRGTILVESKKGKTVFKLNLPSE